MADTKLLVLLSTGLRNILVKIKDKHKCKIALDLLKADDFICAYNDLIRSLSWICGDSSEPQLDFSKELLLNGINSLINDEARMLSFRFNDFEISYLPKGKDPVYVTSEIWARTNRQSAKPARIIQKILVNKYSCKEFEDFSNWIKAEMLQSGEFKLVEGDDIEKYYLVDNYIRETGTLGNSCMRYTSCSDYFQVYKDHAKMLVLLKDDKVLGRAIVWTINGKSYMDRVYTYMDYLETSFVEYSEAQKWYHRENQCLLCDGEYQAWLGPEDNYKETEQFDLTIQLKEKYEYMPYVDSFRYYNIAENSINTNPKNGTIRLSETGGNYLDDIETITCACCGYEETCRDGQSDELCYSSYDDCYYCSDCRIYCEGLDDYVHKDTEMVNVHINLNDVTDYPLEFVQTHDKFVCIDDIWYDIRCCHFITKDENGNYKIEDE